ncbi:MAG TPA: M28 family peptidase [Thermoleophilaceae bacterium]
MGTTGEQELAGPALRERLFADVAGLAAIDDRRTTRPGERRAAVWISDRLAELGATDIRLTSFRGASTWTLSHGAYGVAGLLAALAGGRAGRLLALAALASYEADVTGRNRWIRRLLPRGHGATVEARISARGEPRRTLVLTAHHDAAHMGWVWHPRAVAANRRRLARAGRATPSYAAPVAALLAAASGVRALRRLAAGTFTVLLGLYAQSARSATTPGANDNATGVATVLELARRLAAEPLGETDVVLVFPGGEEAGSAGMSEWLRDAGDRLDPWSTLVVAFDSTGSGGELCTSIRDGFTGHFRRQDLALLPAAAEAAGIAPPREITFFNPTDACTARQHGLRALLITSLEDGWISNLHRPEDRAGNVDLDTVEQAVALGASLANRWDGER